MAESLQKALKMIDQDEVAESIKNLLEGEYLDIPDMINRLHIKDSEGYANLIAGTFEGISNSITGEPGDSKLYPGIMIGVLSVIAVAENELPPTVAKILNRLREDSASQASLKSA